jgi:RNA polymerase sigma factor (sigma-70 family)
LHDSFYAMPRVEQVFPPKRTRASETFEASRSFESFYDAESRTLFRRLWLVTGNRAEVEEIMQDAFLKVWERWEQVGAMDDPVGYLYRTAMNLFRRRYRRAALAIRRSIGLAPSHDDFADADDRETVRRVLSTLPPRQRTALVLTEMLGFSSTEAGLGVGANRPSAGLPALVGSRARRLGIECGVQFGTELGQRRSDLGGGRLERVREGIEHFRKRIGVGRGERLDLGLEVGDQAALVREERHDRRLRRGAVVHSWRRQLLGGRYELIGVANMSSKSLTKTSCTFARSSGAIEGAMELVSRPICADSV